MVKATFIRSRNHCGTSSFRRFGNRTLSIIFDFISSCKEGQHGQQRRKHRAGEGSGGALLRVAGFGREAEEGGRSRAARSW